MRLNWNRSQSYSGKVDWKSKHSQLENAGYSIDL
jgi:hypothetical protein